MKLLSLFIILCVCFASNASQLRAKFYTKGDSYACKMSRQSLPVGSKHVRTFGRHLKHKVNGKTVVYTNEDVTIYDAAYSKNDIEIIPTIILQLFPNLVTMDLRRMNLSSITRGSFQSCDKLKNIYFADDTIKKIEAGVFGNCSNLVSLNFTNNSLPSLNEDAFAGLKKLEVLTLNRNNLKSVSANQFKGLSKLIEITISYQPLYSLPQHIFDDLVKLQILNLNNNLLVNVPGQFFHGKPLLRSVDLRGNHIVAIDRKMMDYLPNRAVVNLLGNVCYNGNLGSIDKFTKVTVEMKCAKCFEKFRQLTAVSSNKTTPNPKSKKAQSHPARKSKKVSNKLFDNDSLTHDRDSSSSEEDMMQVKKHSHKEESLLEKLRRQMFGSGSHEKTRATTKTTQRPRPTTTKASIRTSTTHVVYHTTPKSTTKISTTTTKKSSRKPTVKPKLTIKPVIPTTKLVMPKSREEAIARFYVNAKNEYTAVIKDASRFTKFISMRHIEGFANKNVTNVFFIHSKLANIPGLIFRTFPNVKKISASRCGIQILDSELFEVCGKLEVLELKHNKIHDIGADSLRLCKSLKVLDLSDNLIERIESGIFIKNPKLRIIIDKMRIVGSKK